MEAIIGIVAIVVVIIAIRGKRCELCKGKMKREVVRSEYNEYSFKTMKEIRYTCSKCGHYVTGYEGVK